MKKLLITLMLVSPFSYSADEVLCVLEKGIQPGQQMVLLDAGPENGPFKFCWSNGQVVREGTNKDGRLHGLYKKHYSNGQLTYKNIYRNGVPQDGPLIAFHKNGTVQSKTVISKGKIHGVAKFYSRDGLITSEGPYNYGKKHGIFRYYAKDGSLKRTAVFMEGKRQQ
jgi:antitoxin component YwqK of YwqJK toxin-antitoxin module